jgi:hypothetical protein
MVDQPDHSWPVMLIGQDVDITIVVPAGTGIASRDTKLQSLSTGGDIKCPVDAETTIFSVTGSGKVSHLGFYIATSTYWVHLNHIHIYVDGVLLIDLLIWEFEIANGGNMACLDPLLPNSSYAPAVNPRIALTYKGLNTVGEVTNMGQAGGFISTPCEFNTSYVVKVLNKNNASTYIDAVLLYGGYP